MSPPTPDLDRRVAELLQTARRRREHGRETIAAIVRHQPDAIVRAYSRVRFMILRQSFLDSIGQYFPERGEILLELETAFLGAQAALATMPVARWAEVVPAPIGLPSMRQGRRGELLWLALRELIRHDHEVAVHVRNVVRNVGCTPREADTADASVGGLAIGA